MNLKQYTINIFIIACGVMGFGSLYNIASMYYKNNESRSKILYSSCIVSLIIWMMHTLHYNFKYVNEYYEIKKAAASITNDETTITRV